MLTGLTHHNTVEDALKTYDDKCTLRWQALSRSVDATLASYHESVLALTTAIMCDVYGWDTDRALRDAVEQRIERPGLIDGEMNARKRSVPHLTFPCAESSFRG